MEDAENMTLQNEDSIHAPSTSQSVPPPEVSERTAEQNDESKSPGTQQRIVTMLPHNMEQNQIVCKECSASFKDNRGYKLHQKRPSHQKRVKENMFFKAWVALLASPEGKELKSFNEKNLNTFYEHLQVLLRNFEEDKLRAGCEPPTYWYDNLIKFMKFHTKKILREFKQNLSE